MESLPSTPQASLRKVEWTYDAKGRRIGQKSWLWTNSTWIVVEDLKFISDPMSVGRHILELNASNNAVVRSYVWGLDLSGTLDGAGGVGGLLWVTINSGPAGGTHFAAYDGNGNVVGLVSASTGTETARYEYGPFGEPLRLTGPMAKENPFRFSTKRADDTTDLVLYEYRGYSSTHGRWLSRDPIEGSGIETLYCWVQNDSANEIDLLGNQPASNAQQAPKVPRFVDRFARDVRATNAYCIYMVLILWEVKITDDSGTPVGGLAVEEKIEFPSSYCFIRGKTITGGAVTDNDGKVADTYRASFTCADGYVWVKQTLRAAGRSAVLYTEIRAGGFWNGNLRSVFH